jgi:hypothetical protein
MLSQQRLQIEPDKGEQVLYIKNFLDSRRFRSHQSNLPNPQEHQREHWPDHKADCKRIRGVADNRK